MRRILLIIGAVIILIGIGIGIYFLFFRGGPGLVIGPGDFPGSGNTDGEPEDGVVGVQDIGVALPGAGTEIAPRFLRISDRPVAFGAAAVFVPGTTPVATTSASSTVVARDPDVRVMYLERESGNVYAFEVHARTQTRRSNKTLPGIQEANWLSDGSLAFVRFLQGTGDDERVDTYALPADGENGYFLEQNLAQVLVKGTSTLVTVRSTTEGSQASVSTPTGGGLRTLFSTPLSSILIGYSGANFVVWTKGSAQANSYAFLVDARTGAFTRALGPLKGFSVLPSPSGRYLLYSYLDRGKLALAALDLSTRIATRLPLATLPEKCAWTSDDRALYCGVPTALPGTLPDDWYQGAVHFTDRIWKIDLGSRVATLVIDPKEAGELDVDAVGLTLDRTNDVLVFKNRRDHLLYTYDL